MVTTQIIDILIFEVNIAINAHLSVLLILLFIPVGVFVHLAIEEGTVPSWISVLMLLVHTCRPVKASMTDMNVSVFTSIRRVQC